MEEINLYLFQTDNPQTWLYSTEYSDINGVYPELDLDTYKTLDQTSDEFKIQQNELFSYLDNAYNSSQKHKFDSRTYTRSKKRNMRPGLPEGMMSNLNSSYTLSGTETLTKPKLRMVNETHSYLDRFNSSLSNDMDSSMDDDHNGSLTDSFKCNDTFQINPDTLSESMEDKFTDDLNSTFSYTSKPININLQEPVHNIHNTFNNRFAGLSNTQIDSFTNMSPPSLVSSIAMDGSGTFNSATFSRQGSMNLKRDVINDANDDNDDQTAHNSICSSMTTSILDEKEMSTSFLSQAGFPDNDSFAGDMSPSMIDSFDFNNVNTSMYGSTGFQSAKDTMESSMISSMTFNNMIDSADEKMFNGKSNFHLRKSFLKTEPGDQEKVNKYLTMNKKTNRGDLSTLAENSFASSGKHDLNSTFQINESPEKYSNSDSFLLTDKMTDSFIKCTGRESLNTSYQKIQSNSLNINQKHIENQDSILLPNQNSVLSGRKSNGVFDTINKNSPKRNATFRKISPTNDSRPEIETLINDTEIIDSNKKSYENSMRSNIDNRIDDIPSTQQNISLRRKDVGEKQYLDGRTMTGSSSDSLEGSSCSERSPPKPTTVPLSMADLEYLAYQQHQSLLQDVSTPLPKTNKSKASAQFYQENVLSPILSHSKDTLSSSTYSNKSNSPMDSNKYGTYRLNSSSTGSLNRMSTAYSDGTSSPRRLSSHVKRESSAPEIVGMEPPNRRSPFVQKYNSNQRIFKQDEKYGSDGGLHYGRRLISNSPAKFQYTKPTNQPMPSYNRTLTKYKQSPQLSGSTTELRSRQCGLPASKLRQYSSHKELNRIPGPPRWSAASSLQQRSGLHASNPALCPAPLTRQGSYTITPKESSILNERRDFVKPMVPAKEVIRADSGRLGTQVTNNHNNIGGGLQYGQSLRPKNNIPPPSSGINKINAAQNAGLINQSYLKTPSKPAAAPSQIAARPVVNPPGPAPNSTTAQRIPRPSGLPRPSSGIPRKSTLRPPSTYSLAPRPNDQTDCY